MRSRCSSPALHCSYSVVAGAPRQRIRHAAVNGRASAQELQTFPETYEEAISGAQAATKAAIADGLRLIEVEFPTGGLSSVSGDSEGVNEMTYSLEFLRKFLIMFQLLGSVSTTRVFFPDKSEMAVAQMGKAMDRSTGSLEILPLFDQTAFRLDYLTDPTGLMDFGIDLKKVKVIDRVKPDDSAFVIAYPHFNVNEIICTEELWTGAVKGTDRPLVVFNGELDRLRSNYYPPFFYPKISKIGSEFIPQFEAAYYIHNFKGSKPGALHRAYPGPWQVMRRERGGGMRVIHTSDTRPTLKEVSLEILPSAA